MKLFTYGCLMNPPTMREVASTAEDLGHAVLEDHELAFTAYSPAFEGGVADVVEREGSRVEGVLWAVDGEALQAVDDYEGVGEGHYERVELPVTWRGRQVDAGVYKVVDRKDHVAPSAHYLTLLLRSARRHAFSEEYVEMLASITPRGRRDRRPGSPDRDPAP